MKHLIKSAVPLAVLSTVAASLIQADPANAVASSSLGLQRNNNPQQRKSLLRYLNEDNDSEDNDDNSGDEEDDDNENGANDDGDDEAANQDENGNDDDGNGNQHEVDDDFVSNYYQYDDQVPWTDDEGYTDDNTNKRKSNYKNDIANAVYYSAWEFYEVPPSQWTDSQWNVALGLLFGSLCVCCVGSVACALHCMRSDPGDDDVTTLFDEDKMHHPLSPKAHGWSPRRGGRGGSRSKHRDQFTEDHYKRYQEQEEEMQHTMTSSTIEHDDTMEVSLDEDGGVSYYEPPQQQVDDDDDVMDMNTSSLADYTSVQREKEARILEEWKKSNSPRKKPFSKNLNGVNINDTIDEDEMNIIVDPGTPTIRQYRTQQRNRGFDDWDESVVPMKSGNELDAALSNSVNSISQRGYSTKKSNNNGEDKLLEARERKHNFVGYYLS